MNKLLLTENWQLRRLANNQSYETSLPSSVLTVLKDNGVIPDPYWQANEDIVRPLMEEDYEYTCTFAVGSEMLGSELILLRFEGLDTIADISLNGVILGRADNMHRTWEYSVRDQLIAGTNQLTIILRSPFRYAEEAFRQCPTRGTEDAWQGFSHVRKAHYMYGWDWGAHLPDAGIFRDVSLLGINGARIDSIYIRQQHEQGRVFLRFEPLFNLAKSWNQEARQEDLGSDYTLKYTITEPDGSTYIVTDPTSATEIQNPQLWWPNGLGKQPLYTIGCELFNNGKSIDSKIYRIGLRILTIRRQKDEWGESFAHEVNGHTVFAMGADYIPEEHLLPGKSSAKTRQLLEDCVLANYNSVRVWGGGYYPDDEFFELCDSLGLIVWEDFMFACSVYELTPEFEANITAEFIDNIKRIRHHASLGLWCGNNEMESFVKEGEWVSKPSELRDYLFMYERILPQVLAKYDPDTFYWPASPSSGGSFDDPQSPDRGDVHYWDVWHGNKPFSEYRKFKFRYLSEFGFQALPALKTIIEGISNDPDDHNLFSYVMEKHQRHGAANGKIMNYLQQTYKYPYNFSDMVYASQLLQADAIRYGVEHFRRNRGRCMGAVYWQLNDCWPVISWSSIDYYGRWKALHYFAKRFFAPVMISCEEQNWMTAQADFNRQNFTFEKSIRLNIANETLEDQTVQISWALRNADASIVRQTSEKITVPALSAQWFDKIELPEADMLEQYVSYEAVINSETVSSGTILFSYPKYFRFRDPKLVYRIEGDEIVIQADSYARCVEILNENEDLLLSDNYFDMNAGNRRLKILRGNPDNINLRSVYDIGKN
ncbi:MAG: beta-mannosidase [Clostridiales bacterium]|jgi:beta-mannosidase|nr:beta-mannosidase [Clostridiales bacterium]